MILNLDNYNDIKHKEFLENISDSTLELSFKTFDSLISFLKEIGEYTSPRRIEIKQNNFITINGIMVMTNIFFMII